MLTRYTSEDLLFSPFSSPTLSTLPPSLRTRTYLSNSVFAGYSSHTFRPPPPSPTRKQPAPPPATITLRTRRISQALHLLPSSPLRGLKQQSFCLWWPLLFSLMAVMYPSYAKWIKSHRDLPLKLNQWNNVVVSKGTWAIFHVTTSVYEDPSKQFPKNKRFVIVNIRPLKTLIRLQSVLRFPSVG